MPRALSADRDLWGRTLSLLLIGFICYALPWSVFAAEATTLLRMQGCGAQAHEEHPLPYPLAAQGE